MSGKNDPVQGILFDSSRYLLLDEFGNPSIRAKVSRITKRVRKARQTTREKILSYYPIPVIEHHGFLSRNDVDEIFSRLRFTHPIHHQLIEDEYARAISFPENPGMTVIDTELDTYK